MDNELKEGQLTDRTKNVRKRISTTKELSKDVLWTSECKVECGIGKVLTEWIKVWPASCPSPTPTSSTSIAQTLLAVSVIDVALFL